MHDFRLRRRSFLAGAGTTAVGTMLRPLIAYAQAGITPQRLLLIHRPCGTALGSSNTMFPNDTRWWPTGGTTGWTASPLLSSFTDGKIASLQNSMVVLKHINCPRNMNWLGDKHGAGYIGMMTPPLKDIGANTFPQTTHATPSTAADPNGKTFTAADQSIDQLLLKQIPGLGAATCPIPSVVLTASIESADQVAQGGDAHCLRVTSYKKAPAGSPDPTIPLWPEASPANAFKNYFGSGLMNMDAAAIARAAAQKKSVLDFAGAGLSNLKAQVPPSQMPKIQSHLDAISQLEKSLAMTSMPGTGMCTPPTLMGGAISPTADQLDAQTYPIWLQQKAIIKTLFQCDLTRVVSFTFGYGNSAIHFQNVLNTPALAGKYKDTQGNAINDTSGHHDISHNQGTNPNDAQYIIDKYYCDRTAELLADMAATPDIGGGTLLDNTMVVFWSEASNGNAHGAVDMPVLLFGAKFLKMKGGSQLTLGGGSVPASATVNKPPAPYMSDFWVTLAQTWGYTSLTTYGDPSWNTGPISGIFG
jgi:uncharacterized protein DUF1552